MEIACNRVLRVLLCSGGTGWYLGYQTEFFFEQKYLVFIKKHSRVNFILVLHNFQSCKSWFNNKQLISQQRVLEVLGVLWGTYFDLNS